MFATRALRQVAQELADRCKAQTPALRDGEKVISESFIQGCYIRYTSYQGNDYIFSYQFKSGGGSQTHHFCVKKSSPQLCFVI